MIAICTIREQPHYRRDAFLRGLERVGYQIVAHGYPSSKKDFFITWNRYGQNENRANQWEADGGTVLVAENGYLGHDDLGRQYYALGVHGHNGSGWFPIGNEDRFGLLGVQPQPWKTAGEQIVVRGQRGIGTKQMASPPNWHQQVGKELRAGQSLPVKIIEHPAIKAPERPIEDELEMAKACVVWSSTVGIKALVAGVPTWYAAPHFICELAAKPYGLDRQLMMPVMHDTLRFATLQRMAYGQWSVAELESGEPFARLRDHAEEAIW